jgi:hypothetical protein
VGFADLLMVVVRHALEKLGAPVDYTPPGGATVSVRGIFDAVYTPATPGSVAAVSGGGPAVFFKLEDLPNDPDEDEGEIAVVVNGIGYTVAEVHKDGQGGVICLLEKD